MTDLLAIDPSVRSPGAALFRDGVLIAAGKVKIPAEYSKLEEGDRWQRVAECIVSWTRAHNCLLPAAIVYERPQIYVREKSKGDPNDLIALAAIGAAVCAYFEASSATARILIETPTPAQWSGQIPKATKGNAMNSPRAMRILSRLFAVEVARMPNQHDAIDAVGLGLHALGRLGIRRVYSSV